MLKYLIETKDSKYVAIIQRSSTDLYVYTRDSPLYEQCWFNSEKDISECINSLLDHDIPYKGFNLYGLKFEAIAPVAVKYVIIEYKVGDVPW